MTPDTLVACLTPPGRSALATLAVRGPLAWGVVRELFQARNGKSLPDSPPERAFWLGQLGRELPDEVVLVVRQAEPLPWLEIHAHGGPEVIRLLVEQLTVRGLRAVRWPAFLRDGAADHLRAEATVALASAPTVRTAAILLDQVNGALSTALARITSLLQEGQDERARAELGELVGRIPLGRHLTEPWRVVIAGPPNVGKSSLVNALAGYQRSIVAPTPGTTRDVVSIRLALDGWPIELSDTAGLRTDVGILEGEGIRQARKRLEEADLVLGVLDAGALGPGPSDLALAARGQAVRWVINKVDLAPGWDLSSQPEAVRVAALTGEGIGELAQAISRWLVPAPSPPGAAVPFTEAICSAIEEAGRLLQRGEQERARQVLEGVARAAGGEARA